MQTYGDSILTRRHFLPAQFSRVLESAKFNDCEWLARGGTTSGDLLEAAFHSTGHCETIFVSVGTNDLRRGVAPTTYQSNIQGIAVALQARCDVLVFVDIPFTDSRGNLYREKLQGLKNRYPNFVDYLVFGEELLPRYFKDSVHFNCVGASVLHRHVVHFLYTYYALIGENICI